MELVQYMDAYKQFLIIYGLGFIIYFVRPRGLISVFEALWNRLSQRVFRTRAQATGQSVRAWS